MRFRDVKSAMFILVALILMKCLYLEGKLFGDHICQTEVIEPREVLQWELKSRTVRTYKWCANIPPRCSSYSTNVYNETKTSVINVIKSIEACCDGFHEQHSYCISMCQDCKYGLCLKGACICQSGWEGPNCDSQLLNSKEDVVLPTVESVSTIHLMSQTTTGEVATTTNEDNNFSTILYTLRSSTTSQTNTPDLKESSTIIPLSEEKVITPSKENHIDITSPKNSLELNEESGSLDYFTNTKLNESKKSEEAESIKTDSTENVYFDTTLTQLTLESSTGATKDADSNLSGKESVHYPIDNITITSPENLNPDMDYRELGGESFEDKSLGLPTVVQNSVHNIVVFSNSKNNIEESSTQNILKTPAIVPEGTHTLNDVMAPSVLQNGIDKIIVHLEAPQATSKIDGIHKNSKNNVVETSTQNMLKAPTSVIEEPHIFIDQQENGNSKEISEDGLDDFAEEKYQKRSSNKNYSENILTTNKTDNNNIIYSVCAASATTLLILIFAIIFFTLKNARKKVDKNKAKKDVAVAVYTTSIFHSPLPEPPTFENPTYLSTGGTESWNKDASEEMIEVQEFDVVFQKPIKNPKLDFKQYIYDHPPSTGSYRASSEVDTLSQYNLSHKSLSGIILEPVYDEIPSRDNPVENNDEQHLSNRYSTVDSPRSSLSYVDNNCLYVNTLGRTKF